MNDYEATGLAEGFISAESEEQVIDAWQHLHDTGLAYKLQGWFGRTAQELIKTRNNTMRRLIYDMFYADEISEDVAYKLIDKLNKIRDKTKYSWER